MARCKMVQRIEATRTVVLQRVALPSPSEWQMAPVQQPRPSSNRRSSKAIPWPRQPHHALRTVPERSAGVAWLHTQPGRPSEWES